MVRLSADSWALSTTSIPLCHLLDQYQQLYTYCSEVPGVYRMLKVHTIHTQITVNIL
jgi:hypothetical protein